MCSSNDSISSQSSIFRCIAKSASVIYPNFLISRLAIMLLTVKPGSAIAISSLALSSDLHLNIVSRIIELRSVSSIAYLKNSESEVVSGAGVLVSSFLV